MPELRPSYGDGSSKDSSISNAALNLQTYSLSEDEKFLQDEQSHVDEVVPSSFIISYHKETYPHPLNSVKEDVEAEEAEEEKSGNFHSLDYLGMSYGTSSLSSSVVSSASLDEVNVPSDRHSFTNKHQIPGSSINSCPCYSHYSISVSKLRHPNLSNSCGKLSSAASSRLSQSSCKPLSPYIQTKDETLDKASCCCKNSTSKFPHTTEKSKLSSEKKTPVWHNPSKSDKLNAKSKKENSTLLKRYGFCRAKSELQETASSSDNKFSSLPKRKKEKTESNSAVENYSTPGRSRKKREINTISSTRDLPQESKNILDKYGTLPRQKAKEMTGRWCDYTKDSTEPRPLLQRSKSIGKESTRSIRTSPSPSSSASNSNVHSPRNLCTLYKQTPSGKLNIKISSPSPRLLGRQSTGRDKSEKNPSRNIHSSTKQIKYTKPMKKHAQIQVNLKWDPDEKNLEEKLRKLEEEYLLLQTRLRNAEANSEEIEQLRMEAVELRRQAENERLEKEELQEELDKTSGKVKDMLTSMEGVEKEFHNRGESLIELENQLQSTSEFSLKMQEKVNQYEDYNLKLRKDLDKSIAAQKMLLQQVQDLEAEGKEIVDFMAEEKNSLAECLKEAELELHRQRTEIDELKSKLESKEDELKNMAELAEEQRIGYLCLKTEMMSIQSNAEDMMVHQGAEVSGASVALTNLTSRLYILTGKLIQDYSISENDIEDYLFCRM